jgi:hypothetical protein
MKTIMLGGAAVALALCAAAGAFAQVEVKSSEHVERPSWYGGGAKPGQPGPAVPGLDLHKKIGAEFGRAIAELPDWNGVWQVKDELAVGVFDPASADGVHDQVEGADFGVNAGGREHPPYNAKYEAIYTEKVRKAKDEGFNDDYVSFCRPQGFPRFYATPGKFEIIVTPKVIWMPSEQLGNIRRIYMDGRPHLDPDRTEGLDEGDSIGHWEGDTLVIDTINIAAGNYDQSGAPYSDQTHVVERLHMLPSGELQADMTITDPVMLTRPWHVSRILERVKLPAEIAAIKGPGVNWAFSADAYCDNNRNVPDANGSQTVKLLDPGASATPH